MPASIAWFDSDGTTPLASLDLGVIEPGEDYITKNGAARQTVAKNNGDVAFTSVTVEIQQVAAYDAYTKVEIATGATPAYPADYVDHTTDPLALGALAAAAQANVWIQVTEGAGATVEQGKLFNLALVGAV